MKAKKDAWSFRILLGNFEDMGTLKDVDYEGSNLIEWNHSCNLNFIYTLMNTLMLISALLLKFKQAVMLHKIVSNKTQSLS